MLALVLLCAANAEILQVNAWRDFMPPITKDRVGLLVSVDIKNCDKEAATKVKVTNLKSKAVWESDLKFTYYLEEANKSKGQRYHTIKSGPEWDGKVLIEVFIDGKWVTGGIVEIGRTH